MDSNSDLIIAQVQCAINHLSGGLEAIIISIYGVWSEWRIMKNLLERLGLEYLVMQMLKIGGL